MKCCAMDSHYQPVQGLFFVHPMVDGLFDVFGDLRFILTDNLCRCA